MKILSFLVLCFAFSTVTATEFSRETVYTSNVRPGEFYQLSLYNEHTVRQQVESCRTIPGEMICETIDNQPVCHYQPAREICETIWKEIADKKFHKTFVVQYPDRKDSAKVEYYLNQDGQLKIQVFDWMTFESLPFGIEILDWTSRNDGIDLYETTKFALKF